MMNLTATSYDARYYDEHRAAGLDYAVHGDWQRRYGRWLVDALGWRGRVLLDVGCACGSIAHGLADAGAFHVCGVDLSEHMISIGRRQFVGLRLDVCDAANLHLFATDVFDGLHCAQVAEHWPPALVPIILGELRRVARANALFFCCLDTEELFARQSRDALREDPTHFCIRSRAWWREQFALAGWRDDTAERLPALEAARAGADLTNDWDYFVLAAGE